MQPPFKLQNFWPFKFRNLWPFTIRFYAIGFIVLMALIFGILGWAVQYKLNDIGSTAKFHDTAAANAELSAVLAHINAEVNQTADNLLNQDETRQQFTSPGYYGYWRENRVRATGFLPSYVPAIELYTPQGSSLAANPLNNMSAKINPANIESYLTRQGSRSFLYITFPIPTINNRPDSPLLGYLVVKIDFLSAALYEQQFSYVNPGSIQIQVDEQEHLPYSQLASRLKFSVKTNPESSALTVMIKQIRLNSLLILGGFSLLFYLMLTSLLAAPLRRLSLHIDALRGGKGSLLAESLSHSLPVAELEKVRHSLNDYQNQLEQMHYSLNEKNDELWTQAHRDPLTGIYNRRGFDEDWEHMLSVSSGHRMKVSLLLFDCDRFKTINDSYGHQTGDLVIQSIAQVLQNTLRQGDRLYRLGGDEFATLFLDIEPELALQTAQRCLDAISQYNFTQIGINEPVRLSAGLACANGTDSNALSTLPKQADIAMYRAKRPGKLKIAVYDDSMADDTGILLSSGVTSMVFDAITTGTSIEMHYQPIVNLANGKVDYYEALVRIRQGDELIMPFSIFPIIEARRLETEFDMGIIKAIENDLDSGLIPVGTGVSLNVSGPGAIDPNIIEKLVSLGRFLDRYRLIVEVTETALITQFQQASANLNKLRKGGFKIALDDFGSGYSSLGYLANMPVDIIKFDITMVRHLDAGGRQGLIVENLATMIIQADYELVAEGIETEATLKKIMSNGFARGQGYLFGRPEKTCRDIAKFSLFNNKTE